MSKKIAAPAGPFTSQKKKVHIPVVVLNEKTYGAWLKKQTAATKKMMSQSVFRAAPRQSHILRNAKGGIEAVLLDLGLPDRDGLELISAIRAVSPAPVIVVSARGDVAEKVAALDLGAADFVTKPFDGDELRARLRAALRQGNVAAIGSELCHGPICMAPDRTRGLTPAR